MARLQEAAQSGYSMDPAVFAAASFRGVLVGSAGPFNHSWHNSGLSYTGWRGVFDLAIYYLALSALWPDVRRTVRALSPLRPSKGIATIDDALGRKTQENPTPPDGPAAGIVTYSYGAQTTGTLGLTTTITDQAAKKRMSVTDALGQLVDCLGAVRLRRQSSNSQFVQLCRE